MKYFDLVALWIGRAVLAVALFIGLCFVLALLFNLLKFPCRRPYYSIKHLLPWKFETEKGWQALQKSEEVRQKVCDRDEWPHNFVFTRHGKFGVMTDKGKHKWWEPTHRFYVVK